MHKDIILQVAFSPDNHTLATAGADGAIYLWDVAQADPIQAINGDDYIAQTLCFSPDGNMLIAGGDDYIIRFFFR